MNELMKKIVLVNVVSVVILALVVITGHLYGPGVPQKITDIIFFFHAYIFPIYIVAICLIYQKNNPNISGYVRSLLIPLSYAIIGTISILGVSDLSVKNYELMELLYLFQFGIIFASVLSVNMAYIFIIKIFRLKR